MYTCACKKKPIKISISNRCFLLENFLVIALNLKLPPINTIITLTVILYQMNVKNGVFLHIKIESYKLFPSFVYLCSVSLKPQNRVKMQRKLFRISCLSFFFSFLCMYSCVFVRCETAAAFEC